MRNIEIINRRLERPAGRPGMVFDKVLGLEIVKDNGEKITIAVKMPRSVAAEKIEKDMVRIQDELRNIGEGRFVPTYRLPGTELMVQRWVDERPWNEGEQDQFWRDITTREKSFSVSQFSDNVLCDRRYGPVIIDVINVHFGGR